MGGWVGQKKSKNVLIPDSPYLIPASLNSHVFLLFQVLYNQFKFFLNLFFLIMATSQFIPQLRIGYIYTYWAPLGFVIAVTMIREAIDDFRRYQRDKEVNGSRYTKLTNRGKISLPSSDLKVGDIIYVEKGHRVPADMILLRTTEISGMYLFLHYVLYNKPYALGPSM